MCNYKTVFHIGLPNDTICKYFRKEFKQYFYFPLVFDQNELKTKFELYKPELVFFQVQSSGFVNPDSITFMKGKTFIVNWTGDFRQDIPKSLVNLANIVDITLFSNERDVEIFKSMGYNSDFLQIGYDYEIYYDRDLPKNNNIIYMGNNYNKVFPLSDFRNDMNYFMFNNYPNRYKIYGNNWSRSIVPINNSLDETKIYNSNYYGISLSHFNNIPRYTSDRVFRIMGSKCLCLMNYYPNYSKDFIDMENVVIWKTLEELKEKINYLDNNIEEINRITLNGYNLVKQNYTYDNMVKNIISLIK